MTSPFRRAASAQRASLEQRAAIEAETSHEGASRSAPPNVRAITFTIEHGMRTEVVALRLQQGALATSCTCGATGCPHVSEALALLDPDGPVGALDERFGITSEPAMRLSSEPAPLPAAGKPGVDDRSRLAEVLSDVVLAVARAGAQAGVSVAVLEALERLVEHAPQSSATGLRVWVGSLKTALDARDVPATVRALAAASAMIDALRRPDSSPEASERIATWLGPVPATRSSHERVSERTYLELSREQRPGLGRAGIEQRYLIELLTGELFREDRAVGDNASLGPCPRTLTVGLALIEPGLVPRRIRPLQYTTTPIIEHTTWEQVSRFAQARFSPLRERYEKALRQGQGVHEQVALVRPARIEGGELSPDHARLVDGAGTALPLRGREGTANRLESFFAHCEPQWVLGRLTQQGDALALIPLAACGLRHGRTAHLLL